VHLVEGKTSVAAKALVHFYVKPPPTISYLQKEGHCVVVYAEHELTGLGMALLPTLEVR